MADVTIQDYYVRDSESKDYKSVLVIAGKGVQSSEINDLQEMLHTEMKYLGDALYGDGSIITGGQIVEQDDLDTDGVTILARNFKLSSALFYWNGYYIKVPESSTITLQPDETKDIGLLVSVETVSPYQDTSLLDPAVGTRNYNQPGSWRLKVTAEWSTESDNSMFKQVYKIVEGLLQSNTVVQSSLLEVNDTIARYDYSANGSYVIDGLLLSPVPNKFEYPTQDNPQGYSYIQVGNGSAHVQGREIVFPSSVLVKVPWVLSTAQKLEEVFLSNMVETTSDAQHTYKVLTVANPPISTLLPSCKWLKTPNGANSDNARAISLSSNIQYVAAQNKTYVKVVLSTEEAPAYDGANGSLIPMIYAPDYDPTNGSTKYKCCFDSRIRPIPQAASGQGSTIPYYSYETIKVINPTVDVPVQNFVDVNDIVLVFTGDARNIPWMNPANEIMIKYLVEANQGDNPGLINYSEDKTKVIIQDGKFYDMSFVNQSYYMSDPSYPFADTANRLLNDQPYTMDYNFYKKRIDLLVLDSDGTFRIIEGTPEVQYGRIPLNTSQSLKIGNIYNSYGVTPTVESDYYKTLKVSELQAMRANIKAIESTIANMQLSIGINNSTATNKLGQYTEAFLSTDGLEDSEGYLLEGETYASIDTQVGQALCEIDWFGQVLLSSSQDITLQVGSPVTLISNEAMTDVTLINSYQAQTPQNVEIKLKSNNYTWVDKVIENKVRVETVNSGHYAWRYQKVRTGFLRWKTVAIPPTLTASWDETISTTTSTAVSNDVVTVPQHSVVITTADTFLPSERVEIYIDDQNLSVQSTSNPTPQFFNADPTTGQILNQLFTTPTWLQSGAHTIKLYGTISNRAGLVVYNCIPMVTTLTYNQRQVLYWSDPVAQTIQVTKDCFIDSVDLLIYNKGTTYVDVMIFENYVGLPDSKKIMCGCRRSAASIEETPYNFNQTTTPATPHWQNFKFEGFTKLDKDKEYSIVVMTDNTSASVWYSQLSHRDKHTFTTLTNQPYDGVMLKSANSSTWTPFQDSDLSFKLNVKKFTPSSGSVLNVVGINPDQIPANPNNGGSKEYTDVFLGIQEYVPLTTSTQYRYNDAFTQNPSATTSGDFLPQEAIMLPKTTNEFQAWVKMASDNPDLTPVVSKDKQITFGLVKDNNVIITKGISITDSRNKVTVEFEASGVSNGDFEVYIARMTSTGYVFSDSAPSASAWDGTSNCIKLSTPTPTLKGSDLYTMAVTNTVGPNITNPANYFFQAGGSYRVKVKMKFKTPSGDRRTRPSISNLTVFLHS